MRLLILFAISPKVLFAASDQQKVISISLHSLGKKFNREWIFRHIDFTLQGGEKLLIQGGNGSGKSTLLQVISGYVTETEGKITYLLGDKQIEQEDVRKQISLASPYLQLIEELTPLELIAHLSPAKPLIGNFSPEQVLEIAQLQHAQHKYIRQFSSGMKQRLKLALAILADTPLLLLDEPLSNLDRNAADWYKKMIETYTANRTVIVCSNAIAEEHFFCTRSLNVMDHKV